MVPDTSTSSPTSRPRLNPFAFPSDTDFRFVILIVAVLSASLFIYQNLYFALPANAADSTTAYVRCFRTAYTAHPTDLFALNSALTQCVTSSDQIEAVWIGLSIALLLSVAGVIYWAFPAWKIWRGGLKPLSAEHAPSEMIPCLSDLCRKAGLTRSPVFLLNAYSRTSSGLTFGRLGRYYVVLNSGLIMLFQSDPAAFSAIVLHELGHIRNADVDKTYFTIAIGWAFALAALLPWIAAQPFLQWNLVIFVNVSWRVLALALLIYLTIISILRTREIYADVRASVWDGPKGALRRMLEATTRPKGNFWQRLRQTHPEPEERREALDEPSRLFQMRFWMAFATGITAASAIINVELISVLLHLGSASDSAMVTGIIFAFLVVGVVGIVAWRATFDNLVHGKSHPGMLRASFGLALGLLLGQTLPLFSAYTGSTTDFGYFTDLGFLFPGQFTLTSFFSEAGSLIFWSLLLLLMLYCFLRWVVVSAETWLAVAVSNASLRRSYWIGMIIAGVVLGILFWQFYYLRSDAQSTLATPDALSKIMQEQSGFSPSPIFLGVFQDLGFLTLGIPGRSSFTDIVSVAISTITGWASDPLTLLTFASIWAFPFVSRFWLRRTAIAHSSGWAFLEPSTQQSLKLQLAPLRLRFALLVGLAGGLGYLGLLVLFMRLLPPIYVYQKIELAVLVQIGMAAIVSAWVSHLSAIHGLFTAFVIGCIAAIAILVSLHGFDPVAISAVNTGMLAALPVVLIVSPLARWIRFSRQRFDHAIAALSPGTIGAQ